MWWLALASGLTVLNATPVDADSVEQQAADLANHGHLDAALEAVTRSESTLLPALAGLMAGRYTLEGELAGKGYETAAEDSEAPAELRGEGLFRLGQYYYADGAYNFSIPQFREYLREFPVGPYADAAAFWMGYSCLQYAQVPRHTAYLDTGLNYVEELSAHATPPANAAAVLELKARLFSAKGDAAAAAKALAQARNDALPDEAPGVWLLSSELERADHPRLAREFRDSLFLRASGAPEARLLRASHREETTAEGQSELREVVTETRPASASHLGFCLQLGVFSHSANAEQMRRRLAAKGLQIQILRGGTEAVPEYRVLFGNFPDALSAQREGNRIFTPLGFAFLIVPSP